MQYKEIVAQIENLQNQLAGLSEGVAVAIGSSSDADELKVGLRYFELGHAYQNHIFRRIFDGTYRDESETRTYRLKNIDENIFVILAYDKVTGELLFGYQFEQGFVSVTDRGLNRDGSQGRLLSYRETEEGEESRYVMLKGVQAYSEISLVELRGTELRDMEETVIGRRTYGKLTLAEALVVRAEADREKRERGGAEFAELPKVELSTLGMKTKVIEIGRKFLGGLATSDT